MNEKMKMVIIVAILSVFLAAMGMVYIISYKEAKAEAYKFYTAYNSNEKQLVFIGRETCYYCNLLKPILVDFDYQYKFGYTYVNTDKISKKQLEEILKTLDVDMSTFGTPYTAIVQNKQKLAEYAGTGSERSYLEFLQQNEIIDKNVDTVVNYINYDKYKELKEKGNTIIVLGDSLDDGYNTMMKYLRNIKAEYNVDINYFSKLELTAESAPEFENTTYPTMIVIGNDKKENVLSGNKTYEEYITFLKNSGIIK